MKHVDGLISVAHQDEVACTLAGHVKQACASSETLSMDIDLPFFKVAWLSCSERAGWKIGFFNRLHGGVTALLSIGKANGIRDLGAGQVNETLEVGFGFLGVTRSLQ